jgi:hypothetical protein
MSLGKEMNELIEKEIQRREEEMKKKYESQTVELMKIKSALRDELADVFEDLISDAIKDTVKTVVTTVLSTTVKDESYKAIDRALENYWKPKVARKSFAELRVWTVNFLNVNAGEIFLANEIKHQIPAALTKDYEFADIDKFFTQLMNNPSSEYNIVQLPTDSDYVTNLVETEMITKKHYGIAKATSGMIKFLTSNKKKPNKTYAKNLHLSEISTDSIAVFDRATGESITD